MTPATRSGGEQPGSAVRVEARGAAAEIHGMGQEPTRFVVRAVNRAGAAVVGTSSGFVVAYALPKVSNVEVTPGNGRLTVRVSTNMPSGSPGFVEYRLGGDWRTLPADGVVGGLENGRAYTLQVRAQLEHRTSATVTRENLMPRADSPAPPRWESASNFRLYNFTAVQARVQEMSYEDTGGWNPAEYTFCTTTQSSCGDYSADRTRRLTPGATNHLAYRYDGRAIGEGPSVTLDAVREPTLRDGDTVTFAFPYVQSGSCQIRYARGDITPEPIEVTARDAWLRAEASVLVPVPDGEAVELRAPDSVRVDCTANGSSDSWRLR